MMPRERRHLPEVLVIESPPVRQAIAGWLDGSITRGEFTPFLGAGASSLRPKSLPVDKEPWREVAEKASLLLARLKSSRERRYLLSLLTDHNLNLPGTYKAPVSAQAKEGGPLFALQLRLVQLGAYLVGLFGQAMVNSRQSVSDIFSYQLPLVRQPTEHLVKLLLDTVDSAFELRNSPPNSASPPVESQAIYEKLLLFAYRLLDERSRDSGEVVFWQQKHDKTIEELRARHGQTRRQQGCIGLDELEWLSDLLWYTLTLSICSYPTVPELAFDISLIADLVPPLHPELSQVAEAYVVYERLLDKIADWFNFCEGGACQ